MASYFIGGGVAGNPDGSSGSGIVTSPVFLGGAFFVTSGGAEQHTIDQSVIAVPVVLDDYLDGGNLGSAFPDNARIRVPMVLSGEVGSLFQAATDPLLAVPVTLSGSFVVAAVVTDNVVPVPTFVIGTLGIAVFLRETLTFAVLVGGELQYDALQQLTREYFAEKYGTRPLFPWIMYDHGINHYTQVVFEGVFAQELDRPFLIAADFTPDQDRILFSLGAKANYIGMVLDDDGITRARFRAPQPNEVILVLPTQEVLRYEGSEWVAYTTPPERSLIGQTLFDLLDPSGVYLFLARMIGLMQVELQYDNRRLLDFIDPVSCPDRFVSLLGDNFGLGTDEDITPDEKRNFIRQFITIEKRKGTPEAIVLALRALGYTGYANHVWVNPGGDGTDWIEKPFGYDFDTPGAYVPASQIVVHLNDLDGEPLTVIDDGVKQSIAEFLVLNVIPAHVKIRAFVTDESTHPGEDADGGITVSDSMAIADV